MARVSDGSQSTSLVPVQPAARVQAPTPQPPPNPGYQRLHGVGAVTGFAKSAQQLKLATSRAKAACTYAKTLYPYLTITYAGKQSKTTGTKARLVNYTLVP